MNYTYCYKLYFLLELIVVEVLQTTNHCKKSQNQVRQYKPNFANKLRLCGMEIFLKTKTGFAVFSVTPQILPEQINRKKSVPR
ncbi:hypothetical protein YQ22_15585 [Maribacter sp. 1_2014MBL_MicDiv]|nr:hypothetical protein YQ22_15585 [Maribacter sp. 1_2014MBL_MicDiv]